MRPISKREKTILAATASTVGLALLYFLGLGSFVNEWQKSGQEIVLLEAKLKRSASLAKRKSAIASEFKTYSGLLSARDSGQMRTQTLSEIEKVTREQSLKVIEMRPLPARRQGPFQEYVVEVNLEGTMDQLVQFIYHLQGTSGLLRVERLQITTKGSQSSLLKAVMTVSRLAKE